MKKTLTKTKTRIKIGTLVAVAIAVISVSGIMAMGAMKIAKNKTNNSKTEKCQNYWWHNSQSSECLQGKFCGKYQYEGLKTFENKKECEKSLKNKCGLCKQIASPSANWCKNGQIISGGKDKCGCARQPICKCSEICIHIAAPPLGWCESGKIIPGGKDECGCMQAPTCSMPKDSNSTTNPNK